MDTVEEEEEGESVGETTKPQVFVPGTALKEGEELVHDSSTYHMFHVVSASCTGYGPGAKGAAICML